MEFITSLDHSIVLLINGLAQKSQILDRGMNFLVGSKLVKITPFVVLLWWFWFEPTKREKNQLFVIESALAALVAMALARLIQNLGPQRPRPRYDESLNFATPFGGSDDVLRDWSSFPSDHTSLVFAISLPLLFHRRWLGVAAILWSAVVTGIPRIYAGYHYPSDVIAGAAIGAACGILAHRSGVAFRVKRSVDAFVVSYPAWFYTGAFLFTYQLADLFDQTRHLGRTFAHSLKYLF
jgi:undecaprenyl-diphosphatase